MNILALRALRGPNYNSMHPTVTMTLDIGKLEQSPSDTLPGFNERLLRALPSLHEHHCSPGYRGGLVERLERGTWAAHIVEHVAIELQVLAGCDVAFGKTRSGADRGVYEVVYHYEDEETGLAAGEEAVRLVDALARAETVDVDAVVARLGKIREENALGPSTQAVADEARRRGIPVIRLDQGSFIQLGHGSRQQRLQATMSGRTASLGVEIADDKRRTKEILHQAGVAVPTGEVARDETEAMAVAARIGYPVVVKPLTGNHGRGITTNVRDADALLHAVAMAQDVHPRVLVERHVSGHDYRILVVGHRFTAAARRDPAHVLGDGRRSIRRLVEDLNRDPARGEGHQRVLTRIELDEDTVHVLESQGLTVDSVPDAGQEVVLKSTANLSSGGTATDVTDDVHPVVRATAERVSRIVGLDIMGIDIVAPTLRKPLDETGGGIVEVNAAPGLRMHTSPTHGKARDVASPILDMLFPPGTASPGRIPIVAVTGTNGKTTTVRLIAHILRYHGGRIGMATTSGVEVEGIKVLNGDYSGPAGAHTVLTDPAVDHAVLEVARGGILRRGLGFDECDVGIVLNVAGDHLGEGGIDTLEDLARVKSTVIEAVRPGGTAVLNAEDPLVALMAFVTPGRPVLFSVDPACRAFVQHLEDGGAGVTVRDDEIVMCRGTSRMPVAAIAEVPLALRGHARFNVENVLAAVAAADALGVAPVVTAEALRTFHPSATQLPGRLNILDVQGYRVVVDYAHNPAALRAFGEIVPALGHGRRINVASAVGNRRDEDLHAFGHAIAGLYDHIILCDADPRGRTPGETPTLVLEGMLEAGFDPAATSTAVTEGEAIEAALAMARPGDLVVLQVDGVQAALARVQREQEMATSRPSTRRPRPDAAQEPRFETPSLR